MPDLTPTDTQTRTETPSGADALSGLHKMSTTAGLGTTEYVAVNAPAVFALIFGLASVLAIVDNILLIVPAAGIVCAIIALRQISLSNGTQTGRALAMVGLLLSLAIGGYVVTRQLTEASRTRADREQIAALVDAFGKDIIAGNYKDAYARLAPRLTARITPEAFERTMAPRRESSVAGKLESVKTSSVFQFQNDPASGARVGAVKLNLKYANFDQPAQEDGIFRMVDGKWLLEDIPEIFPSQPPPQQQQQPPGM